jgi:hypothetical protein
MENPLLMRILLQGARQRFKRCCSVSVILIALGLLGSAVAFSQDATKTAPQAYQLQFENEWVRVTRVHYGPRERYPRMLIQNGLLRTST